MSKHDITTVCCLAAHLAIREALTAGEVPDEHLNRRFNVSRMVADAMALQRLGRSTRNAVRRAKNGGSAALTSAENTFAKVRRRAEDILKPYGLTYGFDDNVAGPCLYIQGLPGNVEDCEHMGYGI